MYRWGKTIFEVLQTCANKWPDRWLIQCDISVVLLQTVISITIGASDQDYPMSTGGGKTLVDKNRNNIQKFFPGVQWTLFYLV